MRKSIIVPGLTAFCAFVSNFAVGDALTVTVIKGDIEQWRIGNEEIVTVRSNATVRFSGFGKVDVLLVGGGGGGGRYAGGGGGGGGVVEMSGIDVRPDTDYVITAGAGGEGAVDSSNNGSNGGDSSAFGMTAHGGGGGGTRASGSTGATGGGGGAWGNMPAREGGFSEKSPGFLPGGASAYIAEGFGGGSCTNNGYWTANGGGGGGAGGAGFAGRCPAGIDGDYETTIGQPGQGGDGVLSTLSGVAVCYGGGGGGGGIYGHMIARGGLGGGGHGGLYNISRPANGSVNVTDIEELAGGNGTDGLGGGGGGACGINTASAGRGGSGVVVFRYAVDAPTVTGQSVTTLSGTTKTEMFQYDEIVTVYSNARIRVATKGRFDILLVGGGGAGGASDSGGGGGGGGVVYLQNVSVEPGDYDVVIGSGGVYDVGLNRYSRYEGFNGGDTSVFGFTAYGGGGGSKGCSGAFGASGGGAGAWGGGTSRYGITGAGSCSGGGAAYGAQGFAGGSCTNIGHWYAYGGGGGGAGCVGGTGMRFYASEADTGVAGGGGAGVACAITGKELYYGGGGGGGATSALRPALGGSGVGGNGGVASDPSGSKFSATDGMDFRGGGGGGQAGHGSGSIGRGGSGVVILRYRAEITENLSLLNDGEATGGDFVRRRGYGLHSFTNDGTFSVSKPTLVDILLVGGGGGGGYNGGGGGGGGGVLVCKDVPLKPGSYTVAVGAGGAVGSYLRDAENGGDSSVFGFRAYGGGAGGKGAYVDDPALRLGKSGATGGGGGAWGDTSQSQVGFSSGGVSLYPDQGFGGGSCTNTGRWYSYGGGGGGAGGVGGDAVRDAGVYVDEDYGIAGAGGPGRLCDITFRDVYYGGGGGGGGVRVNALALGGTGGGGRGGAYELINIGLASDELAAGEDGTDGLGGGGGGGAMLNAKSPGRGGCGTVIIRYRCKPRGLLTIFR